MAPRGPHVSVSTRADQRDTIYEGREMLQKFPSLAVWKEPSENSYVFLDFSAQNFESPEVHFPVDSAPMQLEAFDVSECIIMNYIYDGTNYASSESTEKLLI